MKLAYLVDTDWVVDHLNGKSEVTEKLKIYKVEGLGISMLSVAELYEGVYYSNSPTKDQEALERFLSALTIVGIDEEICRVFAKERGRLRRIGALIGDFDLLIASTALYHNMTLLTNNTRHFQRIQGLSIESVERE